MTGAVVEQPQHLSALELANRVRLERAQVRRDLRAMPREDSRQALADLIVRGEDLWDSATLDYMLRMAARTGRAQVRKWLDTTGLSPVKMFGSLTERQRRVLAEAVRG